LSAKFTTFLIDDCIGGPAVKQLGATLADEYRQSKYAHCFKFESIADIFRQGALDEQWVPRIQKQGYIIITADRGKGGKGGKGQTLPDLCRRYGITHVMLSNELHKSNSQTKADAIRETFEALLALATVPHGSGFMLERARGRLRLVNQDLRNRKPGKKKNCRP
jgi:hypothetical protein